MVMGSRLSDKLWQGNVKFDDIREPIVYPHFRAHQTARPIFQDDNARPHRARIVTDSLAQEGITCADPELFVRGGPTLTMFF